MNLYIKFAKRVMCHVELKLSVDNDWILLFSTEGTAQHDIQLKNCDSQKW